MASRFFKPSRIFAVALMVGASLWIASGHFAPHAQEKPKSETAVATPRQKVGVDTIAPQRHDRIILISGVTQADRRASASTRTAGTVREIRISKGAKVTAGQVIAVLSDEGKQAALAQAKALLEQRQAELNAQSSLIERGIIARNVLNQLESGVATAQAAVATTTAELDKTNVLAPIDGLVDSLPVQIGQALQVGAAIAEVISPDPMLAVGNVPEKERSFVQPGQKVDVRFIDGRTATGAIGFVSLAGEKGTRTYRVEAKIPNADAKIADGVTCEIRLSLESLEALPIPRSALVFSDTGELGVRVVDEESKARFKAVTLVDDQKGTLWVKSLGGPIRLITIGQDFVKDGDLVEAAPANSATAKS